MAKCNMEMNKFDEAIANLDTIEEEHPENAMIIGAKLGVLRRMNADKSELLPTLLNGFFRICASPDSPPKVKSKFMADFAAIVEAPSDDSDHQQESRFNELLTADRERILEVVSGIVRAFPEFKEGGAKTVDLKAIEALMSSLFRRSIFDQQDTVQFLMDNSRKFSRGFLEQANAEIEAYLLKNENLMEKGRFLKFVLELGAVLDFEIIRILKIKYAVLDLDTLQAISRKYASASPSTEPFSRLESLELSVLLSFSSLFELLSLDGLVSRPPVDVSLLRLKPEDFPRALLWLLSLGHFLSDRGLVRSDGVDWAPTAAVSELSREATRNVSISSVISNLTGHIASTARSFPFLDQTLFSASVFQMGPYLALALLTDFRCPALHFPRLDSPALVILSSPFGQRIDNSTKLAQMDSADWVKIKRATSLKILKVCLDKLARPICSQSLQKKPFCAQEWMHLLWLASLSNVAALFDEAFTRDRALVDPAKDIYRNLETVLDWRKGQGASNAEVFVLQLHLKLLKMKTDTGKASKSGFVQNFQRTLRGLVFPRPAKLLRLFDANVFARLASLHALLLNLTLNFASLPVPDVEAFLEAFGSKGMIRAVCQSSPHCMSLLTELFHLLLNSPKTAHLTESAKSAIAPYLVRWKICAFKLPFVDKQILKILIQTEHQLRNDQNGENR